MSSGPSVRNPNPRSARSSCMEDTPRSNSTPSARSTPASSSSLGKAPGAVPEASVRPSATSSLPSRPIVPVGVEGSARVGASHIGLVGVPHRPRPDLQVVVDADHHHVLLQPDHGSKPAGDGQPPLSVQVGSSGIAEEHPPVVAGPLRGHGPRADLVCLVAELL